MNLTVLGNVTYEYHRHDSSCYAICTSSSWTNVGEGFTGNPADPIGYANWNCSNGHFAQTFASGPGTAPPQITGVCGKSYLTCGYTEGQIVKATITY